MLSCTATTIRTASGPLWIRGTGYVREADDKLDTSNEIIGHHQEFTALNCSYKFCIRCNDDNVVN